MVFLLQIVFLNDTEADGNVLKMKKKYKHKLHNISEMLLYSLTTTRRYKTNVVPIWYPGTSSP